MASIRSQVMEANRGIEQNIDELQDKPALLAKNVLQFLRDLVEGLIVWCHVQDPEIDFDYQEQFKAAKSAACGRAQLNPLTRFHNRLQISSSHYTLEDDSSERLMLAYYERLLRIRALAKQELEISILANLEQFPLKRDPALDKYHNLIATCINQSKNCPLTGKTERYYIKESKPFFVDGEIFYEVTFTLAHNRTSKSDRIIAFTDIDMSTYYAAKLELSTDSIDVLGQVMPIAIVRDWQVSVRPCEFKNFAKLLGMNISVKTTSTEYKGLMRHLTETGQHLLDLIDLDDTEYQRLRGQILGGKGGNAVLFPVLDMARALITKERPGACLLRFLLLHLNNNVLRDQYDSKKCSPLSNLNVSHSCRPFDKMPFCSSPKKHNVNFFDLVESIDYSGRMHELLARRIKSNVEQKGMIYTPETDLDDFENLDVLIETHNKLLPQTSTHEPRKLARENGHVFIKGYEDEATAIIQKLQGMGSEGCEDYVKGIQSWLEENALLPDGDRRKIDDPFKIVALKELFASSKVALIYGAAGTGKSTFVNHIANFLDDKRKLFLSHTNPAVDNLRRRVEAKNATFSTISKHLYGSSEHRGYYDLVVIDECSTVSNASLLKLLENTEFGLLILVGDIHQIESIEFGNWFKAVRSYLPQSSVHELTVPFRTKNKNLVKLWDRVRQLEDGVEESLAKNGYAKDLGPSLFKRDGEDEIVLCLNYDGLYGINNVNRFLQASNPNPEVTWGEMVYKVEDPILFNETNRFSPVIFNNMKGVISQIQKTAGRITFDVALDKDIEPDELCGTGLRHRGGSIVQFDVIERKDTDDDDDAIEGLVPFQVAYAVSIHKAQGLEFDSVKVVITDANGGRISHSIFYTAITRARENLEIYWTPETQKRILESMEIKANVKDQSLLQSRRGIVPAPKLTKHQKSS